MKTPTPLVSVLVPCYNSAQYLNELCESIQAQTYQNFEALFLDDGSSDHTSEILSQFHQDSRFQVLRWEINRGVNAATLALLRLMKGDYWCHPDSDDLLHETFIEKRLSLIQLHPEAAILHGPAEYIDERGDSLEVDFPNLIFPGSMSGERALRVLLQHNIIRTSSVFVRSDITRMVLPYFHYYWTYAEDWHLWILHLATGFDLLWDEQILLKYRVHRDSLSCRPELAAKRDALIRLVPLCALSEAAKLSPMAADLWGQWRPTLYGLWIIKALKLNFKGKLRSEMMRLAGRVYYSSNRRKTSLFHELIKNLIGLLFVVAKERRAIKTQSFRVSGLAQIDDPIFR